MTVSNDDELAGLKQIGRIVADTLAAMGRAIEPGMTTRELDDVGRAFLEAAGARSAPEAVYAFPGATCISVNEEIAHGIPGARRIAPGIWSISTSRRSGTATLPIRARPSPCRR